MGNNNENRSETVTMVRMVLFLVMDGEFIDQAPEWSIQGWDIKLFPSEGSQP